MEFIKYFAFNSVSITFFLMKRRHWLLLLKMKILKLLNYYYQTKTSMLMLYQFSIYFLMKF